MRRKIRKLILLQWLIIIALLIVSGFGLYVQRKQAHTISVLIDAVWTLQQLEDQRREPAPAEERRPGRANVLREL